MADDVVGRAIIEVDVSDNLAQAAFAKLRADAARAMSDIDRMEGNATIDADKRPLEKSIAEAKREVLSLEKARAEVEVGADTSELDRKLATAKLKVKELNQQKIELKVNTDEIRDANKQLEITQKREAAAENAALKRARAQSQVAKRREKDIDNEQRALQRMGQAQSRAIAEDARRASARAKMQARSLEAGRKEIDQTIKGRAELARLRQEYGKTLATVQQIQKTTGRPGGIFRTAGETRDLDVATSKLSTLEHEIKKLGGAVDDIDPDLERHQGILGKWGNSLSSVRLQLGFFSATLRQLAVGLVALGPVITGVLGAATSVIGVLGTGLAGGLAVSAAALSGFILTAGGIGLVLKPAISEFNEANKATQAYSKAVLKYGKNSDQAKTAQEQMNHVLAGISPNAQAAAKGWANMKTRWSEFTASTKGDVLSGFNQTIRTANALLPTFAHQTTASTKVASQAWAGWMKSLRSDEAKKLLGDVMAGFRDSIPGLAGGLASLGAAFGRVAASASKLLPGLTRGFAKWANGLEASIGRGAGLDDGLDRIVRHMRDLGHLAQSSGGLLTNLFDTSADSGDDLVRSLTKVIDKWNAWVKSAHGQDSLDSFFGEARGETEKLGGVLARFTNILFQVGRATAPLSNGFLTFATAVGDVVQALTSFAPMRTVLTGLGAVLGGIWVVGKVKAFAGAVRDAAAALKGLAIGNAALGVSEAAGSGGFLARLFGRGGGRAAASEIGAVGGQLSLFAGRAGAATGAAGLLGAALAPEVLIPAGLIAGLAILIGKTGDVETAWESARKEFRQSADAIPKAISVINKAGAEYTSAQQKQVASTDAVAGARQRLLKLQREDAPIHKQTQATVELAEAENQQAAASQRVGEQNRNTIRVNKQLLDGAEERVNAAKQQLDVLDEEREHALRSRELGYNGERPESRREAIKTLKDARAFTEQYTQANRDLATAQREVQQAQLAQAVSAVPVERSYKNLAPLTAQTQAALEKLSSTIGASGVKKLGSFVDPKDVTRATNLSNQLTKIGRGGQVKSIAVKSQGAEQAIGKLQQLQRQSARVDGKVTRLNVKTEDRGAQQKLTQLARLSQRVTGGRNTIRILANASSAEQAIQRLQAHLRSVALRKYEARINAIDNTKGASESAKTKLREAAGKKYTARIDAVDNASKVASKAKGAGDKVARGQYQAKITANAGQALGAISSVSSALSAIDGRVATTTIRTVHETVNRGGNYAGGPSHYVMAPFAIGGPSDKMLERAAEKAVVVPSGPSRKVNKPTMLTGEEGPSHPEYVIATNPAYRQSNEKYLGAAANDLGYEVIPAYRKGKGGGTKKGGKGGGTAQPGDPGPAPFKKQNKKHHKVTEHRFAPKSVEELNTTENSLDNEERKFNAALDRQEQEIAQKKRTAWDIPALRAYITREKDMQQKIINNLIPNIVTASTKAFNRADKELKGPLSQKKVHQAQKTAGAISKEYSTMKAPQKRKDESESAFRKRKKDYEHAKSAKKAEAKEASNYAKRLEKERQDAIQMREDAAQELREVRQEVKVEHETALFELETEDQKFTNVEADPTLAPYYEEPSTSGSEPPTLGEQTASFNQAREDLYRSFAGNLSGGGAGLPQMAGGAQGGGGGGVAGTPSSPGSFGYLPGATTGQSQGEFTGSGNAATGPTPGPNTIINNNFAYPPPDPHTWAAQQSFELGVLA